MFKLKYRIFEKKSHMQGNNLDLLEVLIILKKNTYVRFQVLESMDRWISLEKDGLNLIVNFFSYFDLRSSKY